MRSVTSAWECERRGIDPLPSNPCDPRGRPANYPRLWFLPGRLGLGDSATVPLGVANALLFLSVAVVFMGRLRIWEGLVVAAALCSPPVMSGVERGNLDLSVFAVLMLALMLFRRQVRARVVSHVLFLLAAILKIFPAFAFVVLARQRPRWLRLAAVVGLLFLVDVLLTWGDLTTIRRVVPQEIHLSYGAGVLADALAHSLGTQLGWQSTEHEIARWFSVAGVAVGLAIAGFLRRFGPREDSRQPWSLRSDAFLAGSSIYLASYALFHNYDYRLACLVLTLPQLMAWASPGGWSVTASRVGLALVLVALLSGARDSYGFPYDELVTWLVFVWLSAALLNGVAERGLWSLAAHRKPAKREGRQSETRPTRTHALCPPRPIAFESAISTCTCRASFGT
jgi:hypothetical protein